MTRSFRLVLTLLALAALAGFAYLALCPAPAKAPAAKVTSELTDPYVERGAYYDVSAAYPTTTPLSGKKDDDEAIAAMQRFVLSSISQFKDDTHAESPSPADVKTMGFDQGRKVTLAITFSTFSTSHTVSYVFLTYEDTGGAHGNTSFKTFVFDTTSGTELALASLFTGTDYLQRLSDISRAKLPSVLGDMANSSMIEAGTVPDEKNFESWYLDSGDLVILFPPYAVAPYAAGAQTLRVPLSDLAKNLQSEFRP